MIRYLPILMVALGLLLVSTSFAAAQTDATLDAGNHEICLDPSVTSQAQLGEEKLGRCWKQAGLGILTYGCKVHAALPEAPCAVEQPHAPSWSPLTDPVSYEGPSPPLVLPPPRA